MVQNLFQALLRRVPSLKVEGVVLNIFMV